MIQAQTGYGVLGTCVRIGQSGPKGSGSNRENTRKKKNIRLRSPKRHSLVRTAM